MRPFVVFFILFSFFSAAASVVARTETISCKDERVAYRGNWIFIDSLEEATFSYLRQGPGRATLRVSNASQIGVTVVLFPGDIFEILLDKTLDTITVRDSEHTTWNSSILDPSVTHTISVIKPDFSNISLSLYSFLVTNPDPPTSTTTSTSSSAETPTQQPAGKSELTATTKRVIAGTVVGAVCLGLLGALGIYFWRRRNKHDATLNPFGKVEGGSSHSQSTDALYARTDGNRARKDGRRNGGTDPAPEGRFNAGNGAPAFPLEDPAPSQPPPGSPSDHLSAPPPYVP